MRVYFQSPDGDTYYAENVLDEELYSNAISREKLFNQDVSRTLFALANVLMKEGA